MGVRPSEHPRSVRRVVAVLVAVAAVRPAEGLSHLLDPDERRRHAGRPDRDAAVTAHALLRLLLGEATGRPPAVHVLRRSCAVCAGPHGRARAGAWHVSLARTPEVVAAAAGTGQVGVDVELERRTCFDGFDGVALGEGERAGSPRQRARTWARKEAVLKADGRGLTVDPRTLLLGPPDRPPTVLSWDGGAVRLVDVASPPGSAAALAVLGGQEPDLLLRDGDALLSAAAPAAG